jgi:Na+/H+ antiporter NhaD/arsenite permease-like protein
MPSIPIPIRTRPGARAAIGSDTARSPVRTALRRWQAFAVAAFVSISATAGAAAPGPAGNHFDGASASLLWGLPFAGLLLSIAVVPLLAAGFWHRHYGKAALAWALALLVPFTATFGAHDTLHNVVHALLLEYVPFLAILFALFTIAGGICLRGALAGTPLVNAGLLALGASIASVMGTTGASMLLIRPLVTANAGRRYRAHVVVFFILLVGNVGGALSPLGDPPLFIGFLKGVDFFWTTRALALPTLFLVLALLAIFVVLDGILYRREAPRPPRAADAPPLALEGTANFVLVAGVIGAILLSGLWDPDVSFAIAGVELELRKAARDVALILLGLASLAITPAAVREHNQFHWEPIREVAKLFAAIFVTIFPVLAILEAGRNGALAGVLELIGDGAGNPRNTMVFWVSGLLSAFLDNAPTYLVFFNLAGGDAARLMGPLAPTLAAISMGAVYFGSLTYIGNAPNFMIKAIAEDRGIAMPSFFAYFGYASLVMLPLLALVAALWL